MSAGQRIAITGRGLVGASGCGVATLSGKPGDDLLSGNGGPPAGGFLAKATELFAGRSRDADGAGRFDAREYDVEELSQTWVGAARGFDPVAMLGEQGNVRLLDRASALLIRAAGEALEESGFDAAARAEQEVGLVLGTTFCSAHTIAAFDRRAVSAGPRYASPLDFANTVINAASGQAAIWFDLRGLNSTVAGESASSLEALGYAVRALRAGRARALLVGGVEELSLELLLGLQRLSLLHGSANGSPPEPFSALRSGFAPSEGAAVVMLETLEDAQRRGATIHGEVLGVGVGFDPSFVEPEGGSVGCLDAVRRAVAQALAQAEVSAETIDLLVAGANGSRRSDRCEAEMYQRDFGASAPPVLVPKAQIGEPLGAGGIQQLLAGLAALDGAPPVPAAPASAEGLAECYRGGLLAETLAPAERARHALLSSVGWAGHSAAAVLSDARELR